MTMQYQEDATQAANYLREAIPMMVKHNIHPNPRNFALWYAYVSGQQPELKTELDAVIAEHETCPPEIAQELFRRFIIEEEADFAADVQDQLSGLIKKLFTNTSDITHSNQDYQSQLQQAMVDVQSGNDIENVANMLMEHTRKAIEANSVFRQDIDKAQSEIEHLKMQLAEIQQEAAIDQLTQINNRRAFDKRIQQCILESTQNNTPLALIVTDIDHFKKFNDTYGHLIGDKVLQAFAKLLEHVCQDQEFPARYGGEEFTVLLPQKTAEQAAQLAEKIRAATEKLKIKQRDSESLVAQVTTSLGVAEFQPGESVQDLIDRADKALYSAKESGRNQVKVG